MTQGAPPVFFSYCRVDSDFALRLAKDLKAAGASVWLDQPDIVPGQRWDRAVEDALANCRSMLLILSPASVNSTNVMDEVSFALEEKKTIIPVMHKDCTVPFRLRRVQYVDLRKDYPRGLKRLLKILAPDLELEPKNSVTRKLAKAEAKRATENAQAKQSTQDKAKPEPVARTETATERVTQSLPPQAQLAKEQGDTAAVTFYRPLRFDASLRKPSVFVDGEQVLRLSNGRYCTLRLAPGKHTFQSTYRREPPIQADLKPGEVAYYEMEFVGDFPVDEGRLVKVRAEKAIEAMTGLLPLDAKYLTIRTTTVPTRNS